MKLELFLHAVLQELLAKALPPVVLPTWGEGMNKVMAGVVNACKESGII